MTAELYDRPVTFGDTLLEMIVASGIPTDKAGLVADVICKRLGIERAAPIPDILRANITRQILAAHRSRLLALAVEPEQNGAGQQQVDGEQQLVETDVPTGDAKNQESKAEHKSTPMPPEIAGILSLPG
jgi:hypothetical protein